MENLVYLTFSPHQANVAGILPTFFDHYKIKKRCYIRQQKPAFRLLFVQNKYLVYVKTLHFSQSIATRSRIFQEQKLFIQYNIFYIP